MGLGGGSRKGNGRWGGLGGALWTPTLYREAGSPKDPPHRKGKGGVLKRGAQKGATLQKGGGALKDPPPNGKWEPPPPIQNRNSVTPPQKNGGQGAL